MHHFLYSTKDAYVSNKSTLQDVNFGLDELLSIGVSHSYVNVLNPTKTYHYSNEYVSGMAVENFTGRFTGSFFGRISDVNGTIIGDYNRFTASYFSGSVSGSVSGSQTGSTFFSTNFNGTLVGYNGNIDAVSVNGYLSGSVTADCFRTFTGIFSSSYGTGSGNLTGDDVRQQLNLSVSSNQTIDRSLLKFDISFISQSIAAGDITNPKFYLKLTSVRANELPVTYKIYAFPVSQSWDQGNGIWSDGGSSEGVSWNYRDYDSGSQWFSTYVSSRLTSSVDYLGNYGYVSESFKRGGGTWHNIPCTQSFSYEVSDINMDVTPIVNAWLSNSISNEGFVLMYSGETSLTSSNAHFYFFSTQTNTIYSPRLDVAWDDSVWITGSFGTGSVIISHYNPRISGSMYATASITGVSVSGSVGGNAYLLFDDNSGILSGSMLDVVGTSGTIDGVQIDGFFAGTSSLVSDDSIIREITASLYSGDFSGCQFVGYYSASMVTGILTGSFNGRVFESEGITGSVANQHVTRYSLYQNSVIPGNLIGNVVSASYNGGIFQGVATSGNLKGAFITVPFTGSYSYVTTSLDVTSSVEITGSSMLSVNTISPFVVVVQDLKPRYSFGDIPRINVFGRERFVKKTFDKSAQSLAYTTPKSLPTSSYYAIKDNETEEIIVDYDNYTKLSCDLNGNYFMLDTTGLAQERYYKILLRIVDEMGSIYTFEAGNTFKIQR